MTIIEWLRDKNSTENKDNILAPFMNYSGQRKTDGWWYCRARWETNYGASVPTPLRGFTALP